MANPEPIKYIQIGTNIYSIEDAQAREALSLNLEKNNNILDTTQGAIVLGTNGTAGAQAWSIVAINLVYNYLAIVPESTSLSNIYFNNNKKYYCLDLNTDPHGSVFKEINQSEVPTPDFSHAAEWIGSNFKDFIQSEAYINISADGYYHWTFCGKIVDVKAEGNVIFTPTETVDWNKLIDLTNTQPRLFNQEINMPIKYLLTFPEYPYTPDLDHAEIDGTLPVLFGDSNKCSGDWSTAEGYGTLATGRYAHSEGYGSIAGYAAHAEGNHTEAFGHQAHSEGSLTKAYGQTSHAEGTNTQAFAKSAHAEGQGALQWEDVQNNKGNLTYEEYWDSISGNDRFTMAAGIASHAEGASTYAKGLASHAEGRATKAGAQAHSEGVRTQALGQASHTEGIDTKANGPYAHAEGQGTIASGKAQHVQGKYNIEDTENSTTHSGYSKYAHIVGGGTSSNRKNIYTLDWDGNAEFAKSVKSPQFYITEINDGAIKISSEGDLFIKGNLNLLEKTDITNINGLYFADLPDYCFGGSDVKTTLEINDYVTTRKGTGTNSVNITGATNNHATGYYSYVEGNFNQATKNYAHAEGYDCQAKGKNSHAQNNHTCTSGYASTAIGYYNKDNFTNSDNYNSLNTAFCIGNGTSSTRSANAFTVDFSGNVTYNNSAASTGADYAEYFEWVDQNPNVEDRIGRFVTIANNNQIALANAGDEILGVVSGHAAILGDAYEDSWNGMYDRDIYGRLQYEEVEVEREIGQDEEGNPIYETVTETHIKLNPNYDPTQTYIPRSERPEWAPVGLLGKLVVIDDGSCVPGQKCSCGINGTATASDTGYHVLKRLDDTHIQILLK